MGNRFLSLILLVLALTSVLCSQCLADQAAAKQVGDEGKEPFKIGWIGSMTGPIASYGAYQAARIAVDDINAAGGILGRQLELVAEDARCDSKTAVSSVMKLINLDHVKYIVGGHCSVESVPIAPIVERSKVLMLAAITSSPKLTHAGDFVFRLSPVSTQLADLLAPFAFNQRKVRRLAIVHEETDYARPVAERFRDLFRELGGEVVMFESVIKDSTDFRALILKAKASNPDGIYVGVQAQDTADLFFKQMGELGYHPKRFGNEAVGNAPFNKPEFAGLYEGLVFAEPAFDVSNPATAELIGKFKNYYDQDRLPYGIWTAESYDAVVLLAKLINKCGDDVERVKHCLYEVKGYNGASGKVSINQYGDGVRDYFLKTIQNGKAQIVEQ